MTHQRESIYRKSLIVTILLWLMIMPRPGLVLGQENENRSDKHLWRNEVSGILFEARKVKEKTVPYEYIYFELSVTNRSKDEIEVAPLIFDHNGYLHYELTDEGGSPICHKPIASFGGMGYLKILGPGDSLSGFINIGNILCWPSGTLWPMLSPGRYNITLALRANITHNELKEKVVVTIGPMPFDVVEPAGDDAVALRLYEQGLTLHRDVEQHDDAAEHFRKIMAEYPHTPYDVLATNNLFHARKGNATLLNAEEILNLRKRLLLKHPDNPLNATVNIPRLARRIPRSELVQLYNAIRDREEADISIKYIAREYPWVLDGEAK